MSFGLRANDIAAMHAVFANHPALEQAIIYGSRAKGNYRNGSDIDLTFKAPEMELSEMNQISWELDDLMLPYKFDISLYHQLQHDDIKDHIARVGKVFYEKP